MNEMMSDETRKKLYVDSKEGLEEFREKINYLFSITSVH